MPQNPSPDPEQEKSSETSGSVLGNGTRKRKRLRLVADSDRKKKAHRSSNSSSEESLRQQPLFSRRTAKDGTQKLSGFFKITHDKPVWKTSSKRSDDPPDGGADGEEERSSDSSSSSDEEESEDEGGLKQARLFGLPSPVSDEEVMEDDSVNDTGNDSSDSESDSGSRKQKKLSLVQKSAKPEREDQSNGFEEAEDADEDDQPDAGHADFHPIEAVSWTQGQPIPYSSLVALFNMVEENPSRNSKIAYCADFFRSVISLTPEQLIRVVYLTTNTLAPAYEGVELGVGDSIIHSALARATGMNQSQLHRHIHKTGDVGEAAVQLRRNQKSLFPPPRLTVPKVFADFQEIARASGKDANSRRRGVIMRLLVSCRGDEAKFIIRSLQGKLRIGLAEKSVIKALAMACVITPPVPEHDLPPKILDTRKTLGQDKVTKQIQEAILALEHSYDQVPSHDHVVNALLEFGWEKLEENCFLKAGVPIKAMLGKSATSIAQILKRFSEAKFTLEFKYDGERAQIHLLPNGEIRIYSRNSENTTGKYPDLCRRLVESYNPSEVESFIIDCEVVAWDPKTNQILPFQVLSTRKKKNVQESDVDVNVCLYAFDCLYFNGEPYINRPFGERRDLLHKVFREVEGEFYFATHKDTNDEEEIQEFLQLAISSNCEGLMVKALNHDSHYIPNKRNWIKVKKDYLDGAGDTLDLVPIAAFHGKGKRTGVWGAYLLACYDEESETYQSICRVGTGFKDADLESLAQSFTDEDILSTQPSFYQCPSKPKPDVWFKSKFVWEVKCADISLSPEHLAAFGREESDKGLALRFPRFLRTRPDKKPVEATTSSQALDMYYNQDQIQNRRQADGDDDHFGIMASEDDEDGEDQNAGADALLDNEAEDQVATSSESEQQEEEDQGEEDGEEDGGEDDGKEQE